MTEKLKFFKDKPMLADIMDLIILCVITIMLGKLITTLVILPGTVPSGSMEPTIMTKENIITNRLAYIGSEPKRGDIIVFYYPDDKHLCLECNTVNLENATNCTKCASKIEGKITHYVKRLIGLPGDTVAIKDGLVYVNDTLLDEPYLNGLSTNSGSSYTVPAGHYFMLGDNRNSSLDSRAWTNKFVPKSDIVGKVFFKYEISFSKLTAGVVHSYNDYSADKQPE